MTKAKSLKLTCLMLLLLASSLACTKEKGAVDGNSAAEDNYATFFDDEVRPAASQPCFSGAFYRKIVSSKDKWLGIGGTVRLPDMVFDQSRKNPAKLGQYLDNPSVYLGGNMNGQETDIGLTWEVIKDEQGNVSADRRAFRPFLRRTAYSGQDAAYQNAPAQSDYYWYPGDEVTLSVRVVADGKIRFTIDGAGKHFETDFDCAGFRLNSMGEFKRVNAIDQVANEGKPAQPTKTRVEHAVWKATNLFRREQGKVLTVPLHDKRFTDMRCPSADNFSITASNQDKKVGGESIDINGAGY
ncbi:hypothetical protein [Pedobacter sp. BS3]|uniref:hypothetical protein n=1 Tax=Pedobacter sp. BS3 TaxID=2567937 RepID=UPI00165923D9|nr:hypothetical protein [Pedobacter sp. BS3]